jgi:hypothetical protein
MATHFRLIYFTLANEPGRRFQRLAFHGGGHRGQTKIEWLNNLTPAAGERHDEGNRAVTDA